MAPTHDELFPPCGGRAEIPPAPTLGGRKTDLVRGAKRRVPCRAATPCSRPPRSARRASPRESDEELVRAILAGSRTHFDRLYEAYFQRVYRFALQRVGDAGAAEDATQEVFVALLGALQSWQGKSSLLTWIFGIARNVVNRRYRGPHARFESIDDEETVPLAAGEAHTEEIVEARRLLERCEFVIENQFTPLQRRVFHLTHVQRQSIRAIALALGKTEDAIKSQLYRMRCTLAQKARGPAEPSPRLPADRDSSAHPTGSAVSR